MTRSLVDVEAPPESCDGVDAHHAPPLSSGSSTSPAPVDSFATSSLLVTSARGVSNRSTTSSRKQGAKIQGAVRYLISRVVQCPTCGHFTRSSVEPGVQHAWFWGTIDGKPARIGCDGKPLRHEVTHE